MENSRHFVKSNGNISKYKGRKRAAPLRPLYEIPNIELIIMPSNHTRNTIMKKLYSQQELAVIASVFSAEVSGGTDALFYEYDEVQWVTSNNGYVTIDFTNNRCVKMSLVRFKELKQVHETSDLCSYVNRQRLVASLRDWLSKWGTNRLSVWRDRENCNHWEFKEALQVIANDNLTAA